jgi:hypothetical protein
MQYNFEIEIPQFLILDEDKKHNKIDFDLLYNRIIIGCVGFARSGKDSIAKIFVDDYGYTRLAFADIVKKEMNLHLKESVFTDLKKKGIINFKNYSEIDFLTEVTDIKKILRPYIIWYAETLRTINGQFYWINKAFFYVDKNVEKIIISDVRRLPELDIFKDSNSFLSRTQKSLSLGGFFSNEAKYNVKPYNSLLFYVNQYGLTDEDSLTKETILNAQENWLFDDTFYVDSRIPEKGVFRKKALETQVKEVSNKFNINKPDKTISKRQLKMF